MPTAGQRPILATSLTRLPASERAAAQSELPARSRTASSASGETSRSGEGVGWLTGAPGTIPPDCGQAGCARARDVELQAVTYLPRPIYRC